MNPSGVVGRWVGELHVGWQEQRRIAQNWDEVATAPSFLGPRPGSGRGVIARPLFTVKMGADESLLDARDDFLLVRRFDEFDVPRAVVTRLGALGS